MRFGPPSRSFVPAAPRRSRRRATSPGVLSPSAHESGGGHGPPLWVGLPGCPGFCRRVPSRRLRAPLAGSLSLSATISSPQPSCHFQTGNARGVFPSGDCSPVEAPTAPRRRPALWTFLLGLRRPLSRTPRRVVTEPFLGSSWCDAILRLQGLQPLPGRSAPRFRVSVPRPTCPSWVSASSWSPTPRTGVAPATQPSRFPLAGLPPCDGRSTHGALHGRAIREVRSSLARRPSHLEVLGLRPPPLFEDPRRGLMGLRLSPRSVVPLAEPYRPLCVHVPPT